MSNRTKLKPCPFCGGEAKSLIVGKRADSGEEWYVGCENENCSLHPHSTVPYASAEIAAEAWNRRAENTGSAPVGDMAAMRKALMEVKRTLQYLYKPELAPFDGDNGRIVDMVRIIDAALAEPPRNCDVMSLEVARKLWFAKEIVPRLTGDLPVGKEIQLEEWLYAEAQGDGK